MFKSSEEFHLAAENLIELAEKQSKNEVSEAELLKAWKEFSAKASEYLDSLSKK